MFLNQRLFDNFVRLHLIVRSRPEVFAPRAEMRKYAADSVNDVGRDFLPLFGLAFPSHLILPPETESQDLQQRHRRRRHQRRLNPNLQRQRSRRRLNFGQKHLETLTLLGFLGLEVPQKTTKSERSTSTSTEKLVCMNISMQAAEGNFNRVGLRLNVHVRRIITTRIWISEISNHIYAGGKSS